MVIMHDDCIFVKNTLKNMKATFVYQSHNGLNYPFSPAPAISQNKKWPAVAGSEIYWGRVYFVGIFVFKNQCGTASLGVNFFD